MKPSTLLGASAAGAAVLALLGWGFREPARLVELAQARRAPFALTLQEQGRTRVEERYVVATPLAGTLRRVLPEPGDSVSAGAILAELEPAPTVLLDPASRARAEAERRAAADGVEVARDRVAAARAGEQLARVENERLVRLAANQAVSASQRDTAAARAAQAAAELAAASAEQRVAEQRLAAAAALLREEGKGGGQVLLPLLAPVDGVILRRYIESGGPVVAGQPVLELGDTARLEIEVEALSTDAVRLAAGMRAKVLRWGGDSPLEARIDRIEPGGYTKVSALGVEEQRTRVILALVSSREAWRALGDGFRVEVEFVLWAADDVLQVPSGALFRGDAGWALYVADDGVARRVQVEIGARGAEATQILAGIEPGARVVAHPDDQVREGTRLATVGGEP